MNNEPRDEANVTLSPVPSGSTENSATNPQDDVKSLVKRHWVKLLSTEDLAALEHLATVIGNAHETMEYPKDQRTGERYKNSHGHETVEYQARLDVEHVAQMMKDVRNAIHNYTAPVRPWRERGTR